MYNQIITTSLEEYLFDSDLPVISQRDERLIAEPDCHDLIYLSGVRLPIYYSTWFIKCTSLKGEIFIPIELFNFDKEALLHLAGGGARVI